MLRPTAFSLARHHRLTRRSHLSDDCPGHLHAAETVPTDNRPVVGLKYEGPIKVVYQITSADMKEVFNKRLFHLKKVHQHYLDSGIDPSSLDLKAVFHDDASLHVLTDGSCDKHQKATGRNPNTAIIKDLTALGIDMNFATPAALP